MHFAKNALFKRYDIICLPRPPSTLSVDRRQTSVGDFRTITYGASFKATVSTPVGWKLSDGEVGLFMFSLSDLELSSV